MHVSLTVNAFANAASCLLFFLFKFITTIRGEYRWLSNAIHVYSHQPTNNNQNNAIILFQSHTWLHVKWNTEMLSKILQNNFISHVTAA